MDVGAEHGNGGRAHLRVRGLVVRRARGELSPQPDVIVPTAETARLATVETAIGNAIAPILGKVEASSDSEWNTESLSDAAQQRLKELLKPGATLNAIIDSIGQ